MKDLLDRVGGAFITLMVTALLAVFGLIFNDHETNKDQDTSIALIEYKLSEMKKTIDMLDSKSRGNEHE